MVLDLLRKSTYDLNYSLEILETKDHSMTAINSRTTPLISSASLLLTFAILLFSFASQAFAQTGSITGLVTDASGAVVGSAKVTVTSNSTGVSRDVLTGNGGSYSLVNLQAFRRPFSRM
jgi:hypothetical protein